MIPSIRSGEQVFLDSENTLGSGGPFAWLALPAGLQHTNCRRPPFWEPRRLCYLGRVSEVRLCRINFWQCSAINLLPSRPELFSCSLGWLPVASLRFAVAGKRASSSGWGYGVHYGGAGSWLNRRLWLLLCRIGFRMALRSCGLPPPTYFFLSLRSHGWN